VVSLIELNFEVSEAATSASTWSACGATRQRQFQQWAGRFHSPYGYWNTAFHHGAQLQTSLLRPGSWTSRTAAFFSLRQPVGHRPLKPMAGAWDTPVRGQQFAIGMEDGHPGSGVLNMRQAGATDRGTMVGANLSFGFQGDGLTWSARCGHDQGRYRSWCPAPAWAC
jgi:hypothetical protein